MADDETLAVLEKNIKIKATGIGIKLKHTQLDDLGRYLEELLIWNQKINLISRTEAEDCELVIMHLIDSMTPLISGKILPGTRLVDVGTGAGLPGLVLKIVEPTIELTLLESISKKCDFLKAACGKLGLDDVRVVCDRAENYARGPDRESYDIVVARAVAPLPVLFELSLPLLRLGGYLVAQKGKKATEETARAKEAADVLGGKIVDVKKIEPTGMGTERVLVLAEKIAPTPLKYPRRAGIPAKRPLGGQKPTEA